MNNYNFNFRKVEVEIGANVNVIVMKIKSLITVYDDKKNYRCGHHTTVLTASCTSLVTQSL